MLFTLSSSLLLLVAGSTVRAASPLFEGTEIAEGDDGNIGIPASNPPVVTTSTKTSSHSSSIRSVATTSAAFSTITSAAKLTKSHVSTVPTLTTTVATITGKNGKMQATTFVVPISTPSASHKTSLALQSVTAAAAKATVTPSAASTSSNGTSLASGSKCDGTNDGAVVCSSDGTLFGLCNFGTAVMQPVSKGTACRDGAIDYIANVLGVALNQIKTYLDSDSNATNVFGTADPKAVDAADCPSVLLYLKDTVDMADGTSGTDGTTTALKFTKTAAGKTIIAGSNPEVELVKSATGAASFQVEHQCGSRDTSTSSKSRRDFYLQISILSGYDDF